jgi:hypothetical protein
VHRTASNRRSDELSDGGGIVRGVEHDALRVVSEHPHIVVDVPGSAVQVKVPEVTA